MTVSDRDVTVTVTPRRLTGSQVNGLRVSPSPTAVTGPGPAGAGPPAPARRAPAGWMLHSVSTTVTVPVTQCGRVTGIQAARRAAARLSPWAGDSESESPACRQCRPAAWHWQPSVSELSPWHAGPPDRRSRVTESGVPPPRVIFENRHKLECCKSHMCPLPLSRPWSRVLLTGRLRAAGAARRRPGCSRPGPRPGRPST